MIDLIYCAGGNPRLSQIAYEEGWKLGCRSDSSLGLDLPATLVDVDYKHPDFSKHLETVKRYHPRYATVPDLSETHVSQEDIERAVSQVAQISRYCDVPLIVPKLSGQIAMIPPQIAIGYSVPSGYGGAQYQAWELAGRRIHLLGGSPRRQIQAYLHLSVIAEVMSMDGNYAQGQAVKYAMYWRKNQWFYHPKKEAKGKDLYAECWRWSCQNLMQEWQRIAGASKEKQRIIVRSAFEEDIEAVKQIADANKESIGFVMRPALLLGAQKKWLLVAIVDGTIVGFVHYRHRRDSQSTVYELCVNASKRRCGIGRALLEALIAEARSQGQSILMLKTPVDLPANGFYGHLGFVCRGVEEGKKRALRIWEYPLTPCLL